MAATPPRSIAQTRYEQMFPTLDEAQIERLRRFGQVRSYPDASLLLQTGAVSPGMFVILSGKVEITQSNELAPSQPIVMHEAGSIIGELAQLAGRPSLVDGRAVGAVEAVVIDPQHLRSVLVEEAELGERIMRALILRRVGLIEGGVAGPIIVGRDGQRDVLRLEGFLASNGHPHRRLDPEGDPFATTLLERFHVAADALPIVLCPNGVLLRNPSEEELARNLGLVRPIDPAKVYDTAIIGAGPAGLAAAVYAASEGLSVLVLDSRAFGGQAGASARIENYLGFPTGITGIALMARAYTQAEKFGAEMAIPDEAAALEEAAGGGYVLVLKNGERVSARTVVIATGARYRRLAADNLSDFEGSCVHYWASPLEARLCRDQEVALVGGGNSAGQAAVYLAGRVEKVWLIMRGHGLAQGMSRYLVKRIAAQPNIEVVADSEVCALVGERGVLRAVRWRHRGSGAETQRPLRHLFLFIGAEPNTDWLRRDGVELDNHGFVRTGGAPGAGRRALETSRPGVFAIGDVRSGSIKRVAAAVGEGAQVVASLHAYLAEL